MVVGCAGWHYDDWVGVVYPPRLESSEWLAHYARTFPAVEIDSTFYRIPAPAIVAGWIQKVEAVPRFTFAAKVPQEATHEHLPAGRTELATQTATSFLEAVVEPLERAGRFEAALVQLPPTFSRVGRGDPLESLRALVASLEPSRRRVAVEFRHGSWYEHLGEEVVPDVVDALTGLRCSVAKVDGLGSVPTRSRTAAWSYHRFHGRRKDLLPSESKLPHAPYNYLYSEKEILELAGLVRRSESEDERTVAIFNNHYRGQAAQNAAQLAAALGIEEIAARVRVPKESKLDDFA